ncbi:MAG: DUF5103 domain-containing protein [Bacteroidetes bacterium]|jgi:hypothetical protein|nr:DUF5103 domain-containing protein [Bacteroidota bacterium]
MPFRSITAICWLAILAFPLAIKANPIENKIFKENIRTVEFKGADEKMVYPVLRLGTAQSLWLTFDDLDGGLKDYQYTLIHCGFDWAPSNLMQNEYLSGVFSDYILANETSFNTYVTYTHYEVQLPSDMMKPRISGNYIVKVYEDSDESNVVMTLRMMVYERSTTLRTAIARPTYARDYLSHQEVDVWINVGANRPMDIEDDFKLAILQNGQWYNAITGLKPRFFNNGVLDYNYEDENLFAGSNEFRFFDTRNVRFGGQRLAKVYQDSTGLYHAVLYPDKDRSGDDYLFYREFNGQTLIAAQQVGNENVEGDYIMVHITAPATYPAQGRVFMYGGFSNWQCDDRFELTYNETKRQYEGAILLKQGYYNYLLAIRNDTGQVDITTMEGSYYETENDYLVFFYMYSMQLNCDLLIGYQLSNSQTGQWEGDEE